jgi:hypothetical protein
LIFSGRIPTIQETATNVKDFFLRPTGQTKSTINNNQTEDLPRDLVLILDSSGSIGTDGFILAKEQLSTLVGLLCPIDPFSRTVGFPYLYNQAAMVTYSTHVTTNFYFNTFNTTVSVQNAIKSATYEGLSTYTNKAFDRSLSTWYRYCKN